MSFNPSGGLPHQPPLEAAGQVGPDTAPELDSSDHDYKGGGIGGTGSDGGNETDPGAIANLYGDVPGFCRVKRCPYWHTDPKQLKRHRDNHFLDRHGYRCPNQTNTCPSPGWNYRRRDAVNVHCKRFEACGRALEANQGKIMYWGTPATERDLIPEDPSFHIPYKRFDGRKYSHEGGQL